MIQLMAVTAKVETSFPIAAIVLAAGGSVRMGQPKQLLTIGGRPMVRRVAEAVCGTGLAQVVVVVGAGSAAVAQALAGLPVTIVVNETWANGLSTSMRVGIRTLRPEIQAALIVLADQPALTADLLKTLVVRYHATGAPIVAPFFQGRRGNPVLFDRTLFPELLAIEGDQGGRALIGRYGQQMERVDVNDAAVTMDIDTRQDYESVREPGDDDKPRRQ